MLSQKTAGFDGYNQTRPTRMLAKRTADILIIFVIACKVAIFIALKQGFIDIYSSGNDSNLYHRYATYEINSAPNFWPVVLRTLNDYGLYDRNMISVLIFGSTVTLIPWLVAKILRNETSPGVRGPARLVPSTIVLIALIYPYVLLVSLDLYRDIPMLVITLVALLAAQKYFAARAVPRLGYLGLFVLVSYVAYLFREYLGASLVLSFGLAIVLNRFKVTPAKILIASLFAVATAHFFGLFDSIITYRGELGFETGATSFGLGLVGTSVPAFFGKFLLSFSYQVLGLYVTGFALLVFFFLESVPVLFMIKQILAGSKYISSYCRFVFIFGLIYSFVWVIGNDNMGTALRLRIPTYFTILLVFGLVAQSRLAAQSGRFFRG
jgi:hypothetical protein